MRAMFGEKARWGDSEYLLAQAVDYLQAAILQQSGKGGRGKFKPVPRPGSQKRESYGNRSMSIEQLRRRRAQRAAKRAGEGPPL